MRQFRAILGIIAGTAFLVGFAGTASALSLKGPTCVKYQACKDNCKMGCLNKCRSALHQCKRKYKDGYTRCQAQITSKIRACFSQSSVTCGRTCRNKTSRSCQTTCVTQISRRCTKAYFLAECKAVYHKGTNTCMPAYKRCTVPCCSAGLRRCEQRRVCKKVKCIKAPCYPVCSCTGSLVCSKACKPKVYKIIRR